MNLHLLWIIPCGMLLGLFVIRLISLPAYRRAQSQNSNESGSGPYNLGPRNVVIVNDEYSFGPSGFSPGGVSYVQVPTHGGALIPKGRKGFGRKK